ncbi:Hypothetical predicted protein [Scomber scombrus]|uniref:Uncharacterized protein n=1 Tax=Scomber scombrus TaxID=13677 RepID=A0AAV1PGK8_SCOSC
MELFLLASVSQLISKGLWLPVHLRPQRRLKRPCQWTIHTSSKRLNPCLCPMLISAMDRERRAKNTVWSSGRSQGEETHKRRADI